MGSEVCTEERLADLMRAALSGDDAAYTAFLRCGADLVRRMARRRVGEGSTILPEDIVQETLLAVHLKRHTWRTNEPILPWLMSIARYKAVDAFRRRGQRVHVSIDDMAEVLAAPVKEGEVDDARQIERAVAGLSHGQQRVVRAIAIEGRSIPETASALQMKETAVRVAFHRGLATIAARIGRQT
jgi:RNA polymerase sigma-70 factor (ECF subfamily)